MIKQSNFIMLCELLSKYQPKNRGIVSGDETKLITDTLHLNEMDLIGLQNMRDFIVLFISSQEKDDPGELDKISAITSIIDWKIHQLGGEI